MECIIIAVYSRYIIKAFRECSVNVLVLILSFQTDDDALTLPPPSATTLPPKVVTRRPSRPTSRYTTTQQPTTNFDEEDERYTSTMREEIVPRRPSKPNPTIVGNKNGHANNAPPPTVKVIPLTPKLDSTTRVSTTSTATSTTSSTTKKQVPSTVNPHNVILAAHPQDNEIAGSVNIK